MNVPYEWTSARKETANKKSEEAGKGGWGGDEDRNGGVSDLQKVTNVFKNGKVHEETTSKVMTTMMLLRCKGTGRIHPSQYGEWF